jgi:hypothetical protein
MTFAKVASRCAVSDPVHAERLVRSITDGGRLPGKTWEPDVLVTYKKRAGVLESDDPHHNARRAMDKTRDNLWLDAGVAFVELDASLRKFLKRLSETR